MRNDRTLKNAEYIPATAAGFVNRLSWCLTGTLLLVVPSSAFADFADVCAPKPFRGAVKTIVLLEAPADLQSASPKRQPRVRYVTDITADGRTAIEVETSSEVPSPEERAKSPTKIRQYDATGRMISEIQNLTGIDLHTTTSCEYDDQGRLARATVTGRDRIGNQTYEYTYGPNSRSELAVFPAASLRTTITLDEKARPIIEKHYDELRRVERGTIEFRYLPEGTEACTRAFDESRRCRLMIYDTHGNMIEERSEGGLTKVVYEYDAAGNWTKRITSSPDAPTSGVWRKITYW